MEQMKSAEMRFPDSGIVVRGELVRLDLYRATVRVFDDTDEGLFDYGRLCELNFDDDEAYVTVTCRMVAEYGTGAVRDLVVVLTGQRDIVPHPRSRLFPCHLDAAYRVAHEGQAFGAWADATVVMIGVDRMRLCVTGRSEFPRRIEIQVVMPATFRLLHERQGRSVTIMRHGVPLEPEELQPIRLRAHLQECHGEGPDSLLTVRYLALAPSTMERLSALVAHLCEGTPPAALDPGGELLEQSIVSDVRGPRPASPGAPVSPAFWLPSESTASFAAR